MTQRLRPLALGLTLLLLGTWVSAQSLPVTTQASRADVAVLKRMVDDDRPVRVLVELAVPFASEGALSSASASLQRLRIERAQDGLAASLPEGSVVNRAFTSIPAAILTVDAAGLDALLERADVVNVYRERFLTRQLDVSLNAIAAPAAWTAAGSAGAGLTVAVIDDGIDASHPMFVNKTLLEACFSSNEPAISATSACPSGTDVQIGPGSAAHPPGWGHGSHVAGIAVGDAVTVSGRSLSGVAKDADLLAIQVFKTVEDPDACGGFPPCVTASSFDILAALEYVYELQEDEPGVDVASVNMSLGNGAEVGGDCSIGSFPAAIANLRSVGTAVVAASGNEAHDAGISFPACVPGVVSVGAVDARGSVDVVAGFSNTGSNLDLLAPGVDILSAYPSSYAFSNGTSMAAPHVAGAFAVARTLVGLTDPDVIEAALKSVGHPVTDPDNGLTFPRLHFGSNLTVAPTLTFQPANPAFGDTVSACVGWRNDGLVPAVTGTGSPFVPLRVELTRDGSTTRLSPLETVASGVAMAGGEDDCFTVTSDAQEGTYAVSVSVDPDEAVAESNETDNDASGSFTITILRPGSDDFADRAALPGVDGSTTDTTTLATAEPDEPAHAGEAATASTWWAWTAPASGFATFTVTASDFAPRLAIYRGEDLESLEEVAAQAASAVTTASVRFLAERGVGYVVAVDGVGGATGDVELGWREETFTCNVSAFDLRPLGDVDGDETRTAADALRLLRFATGSLTAPGSSSGTFRHADLTNDGLIDEADVDALLASLTQPDLPPVLHVTPRSLELDVEAYACLLVGNAGGGSYPATSLTFEGPLFAEQVTPGGAEGGDAFVIVRLEPGEASVTVDASGAESVTLPVNAP